MSYTTVSGLFTGICDAIRAKEGSTDVINHQDIPARIAALSGGSSVSDTPPLESPLVWYDKSCYGANSSVLTNKGSLTDAINVVGLQLYDTDNALLISTSGAIYCRFSETYNDFTMYSVVKVVTRSGADTDYPIIGADGTTDNYVKLAFIAQSATSIRATLRSNSGDLAYYPHADKYAILAITCTAGVQVAYVNGCPFYRQTNSSNFQITNLCQKCKYAADDPISAVGTNAYAVHATMAYNAAHTFDEVNQMTGWLRAKYLA